MIDIDVSSENGKLTIHKSVITENKKLLAQRIMVLLMTSVDNMLRTVEGTSFYPLMNSGLQGYDKQTLKNAISICLVQAANLYKESETDDMPDDLRLSRVILEDTATTNAEDSVEQDTKTGSILVRIKVISVSGESEETEGTLY